MKPPTSDWERITELLAAAAELSPADRSAFLHSSGDPPERIACVQSLLAAYDDDPHFLETEVPLPPILGPWVLGKELGSGGMGRVFEAIHEDPALARRVALKVIGAQRLSPALIESFFRERAILARLEHPAIARLYDTGSTPEGLPYFAMEFVDGLPFDQWIATTNPPLRRRVQAILAVAMGVSYAHRNFIAHGDLKPGNILVNTQGEPRLLDFGIGRIWSMAEPGQFPMLTPSHASPEQLRGEPITAASDVYQLGLLMRAALPAPGRELDAIVLRSLEESPHRRYPTAESIATELQRWLDHRPVNAIPPSWSYRAVKFLRRRPLGAALALALALGVAGTVWQAYRAERHRAEAIRQFQETRRFSRSLLASIPNLPAAAQNSIVESTVKLLEGFASPEETDPVLLLEMAFAWMSLGHVQGLPTAKNLGDPASAARSYAQAITLAGRARPFREPEAVEMLSLLYASSARVEIVRGNPAAAARFTQQLESLIPHLAAAGPSSILATAYSENAYLRAQTDRAAALALYRKAVAAFDAAGEVRSPDKAFAIKRWGALLLASNRLDEGIALYREALAIEQAIGTSPVDLSFTLSDLGLACRRQKRFAEARQYYERALSIREAALADDPTDVRVAAGLASVCWRLGWVHADAGNPAHAIPLGRRAVQIQARLARPPKDSGYNLQNLALAQVYLAEFLTLNAAKHAANDSARPLALPGIAATIPEAQRLLQQAAAHHARHPNAELGAELKAMGVKIPARESAQSPRR